MQLAPAFRHGEQLGSGRRWQHRRTRHCGTIGLSGIINSLGSFALGVSGFAPGEAGSSFSGGRTAISTGIGPGAIADPNVTSPMGSVEGDLYRGVSQR